MREKMTLGKNEANRIENKGERSRVSSFPMVFVTVLLYIGNQRRETCFRTAPQPPSCPGSAGRRRSGFPIDFEIHPFYCRLCGERSSYRSRSAGKTGYG